MPLIDLKAARQMVRSAEVLGLLDWRPVLRRGAQARGPCPVHKSKSWRSQSFSIHLDKGIWRCFRCHASGNLLDLWAQTQGLPIYRAAVDLLERLGHDPPEMTRTEKRNP